MSLRSLSILVAATAAIALLVVLSPQIESVLRLNFANAYIARALVLPSDAPARANGLQASQALVLESDRDLPRLALARARTALAQGQADSAYNDLATFAQNDPMGEFLRANAAWQAGNESAAIEHWRRSGAITLFSAQVIRELGAHNWSAAARDASIAVRIDPQNAWAHYALAEALSHRSPLSARINEELDQVLRLTRDNELRSTALSLQGELRVRAGDVDQGQLHFNEAIRVAPTDARPRTGLALAFMKRNPPERTQAVALLTQVTLDSPWYTAAYSALADCFEKEGDLLAAEKWLLKGLEANRNNADLLFALGDYYSRHEQQEQARAALISALKYETHADELQIIAASLAELNAP